MSADRRERAGGRIGSAAAAPLAALMALAGSTALGAKPPDAQLQIVNGLPTTGWPSVAALDTGAGLCSATFIGCRTVLTAAHCVCSAGGTGPACPNGTFLANPAHLRLFLQHAARPLFVESIRVDPGYATLSSFDCASLEVGTTLETCEITDPAPGTWHVLVDAFAGGPSYYQLTATLLPGNPAPPALPLGAVMVADFEAFELSGLDRGSGDRFVTSASLRGSGPDLRYPEDVISEADGSILVTNVGAPALLRVDPATGDRSVVSRMRRRLLHEPGRIGPRLARPPIHRPRARRSARAERPLRRDGLRRRSRRPDLREPDAGLGLRRCDLLVAGRLGSVAGPGLRHRGGGQRPDPRRRYGRAVPGRSRDRQPDRPLGLRESSFVHARGRLRPELRGARRVAREVDGSILVTDSADDSSFSAVFRVDPATGARSVLSGCANPTCSIVVGAGPEFGKVFGIALEAGGDLLVTDRSLDAVFHVDATTGDRTALSGCVDASCSAAAGNGTLLSEPLGITVVPITALHLPGGHGPPLAQSGALS